VCIWCDIRFLLVRRKDKRVRLQRRRVRRAKVRLSASPTVNQDSLTLATTWQRSSLPRWRNTRMYVTTALCYIVVRYHTWLQVKVVWYSRQEMSAALWALVPEQIPVSGQSWLKPCFRQIGPSTWVVEPGFNRKSVSGLPLLSARPAVPCQLHRIAAFWPVSSKLYCLVTEAHVCEQLAQSFTWNCNGWEPLQPVDR